MHGPVVRKERHACHTGKDIGRMRPLHASARGLHEIEEKSQENRRKGEKENRRNGERSHERRQSQSDAHATFVTEHGAPRAAGGTLDGTRRRLHWRQQRRRQTADHPSRAWANENTWQPDAANAVAAGARVCAIAPWPLPTCLHALVCSAQRADPQNSGRGASCLDHDDPAKPGCISSSSSS